MLAVNPVSAWLPDRPTTVVGQVLAQIDMATGATGRAKLIAGAWRRRVFGRYFGGGLYTRMLGASFALAARCRSASGRYLRSVVATRR